MFLFQNLIIVLLGYYRFRQLLILAEGFLISSAMMLSAVWFQVFGAVKSRLSVEVDYSGKSLTPRGNAETRNKYNSCHGICLSGGQCWTNFGHFVLNLTLLIFQKSHQQIFH